MVSRDYRIFCKCQSHEITREEPKPEYGHQPDEEQDYSRADEIADSLNLTENMSLHLILQKHFRGGRAVNAAFRVLVGALAFALQHFRARGNELDVVVVVAIEPQHPKLAELGHRFAECALFEIWIRDGDTLEERLHSHFGLRPAHRVPLKKREEKSKDVNISKMINMETTSFRVPGATWRLT